MNLSTGAKRAGSWAIGLAVMALLSACKSSTENKIDAASIKQEATSAFMAYIKASNNSDFETLATFYDMDPDFHWIERGQIAYESGAEAVASIRSFAGQGATPKTTIVETRISDLSPTAVLLSANFQFQMLSNDGSPLFTVNDWMTVAMVKRDDGWVIAGGHSGDGDN